MHRRRKKCSSVDKFVGYTLRLGYIVSQLGISLSNLHYCVYRDGLPRVLLGGVAYLHLGFQRLGGRFGYMHSLPDLYDYLYKKAKELNRGGVVHMRRITIFPEIDDWSKYGRYLYAPARELMMQMWPDGEMLNERVYVFRYREPTPLEEIVKQNLRTDSKSYWSNNTQNNGDEEAVTIVMHRSMLKWLDAYRRELGITRKELVRRAIEEFLSGWRHVLRS